MKTDWLSKILADLDDDGPRAVYSDALQAEGDPRGELIAVQCELARLGYATRPPAWDWIGDALIDPEEIDQEHVKKLRKRETSLLKAHEKTWAGELATLVRFERGFIAHASFNAAQPSTPAKLAKLFESAPTLQSLDLTQLARARPESLFECPKVAQQIRALDAPVFVVRALVEEKESALRAVQLRGDDTEGARLLATWPLTKRLTTIGINGAGLGAEDLEKLLGAVSSTLHELQLRQNAVGAKGAALLASSAKLAKLKVLSLLANAIGPEGCEALAASKHLRGLRALDLRKNKIGAKGAAAIGDAFPELRTLDLTGNTLGAAGVTALVSGRGLGKLRELCLQQTGLDDAAITALSKSKLLEHVRVLSLRSNKITDAGAKALAASPAGKNLLSLNINNNALTPTGKKALTESKHLTNARVYA